LQDYNKTRSPTKPHKKTPQPGDVTADFLHKTRERGKGRQQVVSDARGKKGRIEEGGKMKSTNENSKGKGGPNPTIEKR